ncbi:hypothetical protein SEA_MAGRITTE_82 [Microbacterium phage Magritte]|nr:hypothetical protein SEA_MAGRITTE_82 [Microbacterium phage Magritte]
MYEHVHQQFIPEAVRAAVVVESADGTRMVYEIVAPVTLNIEVERPYVDPWDSMQHQYPLPSRLTFSGIFKGGKIWKYGMPGDEQQGIEPGRQEIEGT